MTTQRKALMFGAFALVLIAAGVAYVALAGARVDQDIAAREERALDAIGDFESDSPPGTQPFADDSEDDADQAAVTSGPELVAGDVIVVHRVPGDDYGRLAIRHADGTRTLLERRCMRFHLSAGKGVCLEDAPTLLGPAWRTVFVDATTVEMAEEHSYASPLPSRARVSHDGSLITTTGFVSGASYEDIGGGAETVVTVDSVDRSTSLIGLNQFEVLDDDERYAAFDRQYWGLSFVDNDDFYVTGFYGDMPEIMTGSIERNILEPTGWIGSCPSLSPDGSTLVFKEARETGGFDLVAVDLASGDKWQLNETRSVDDQVEWLDNDTILYALHPDGDEGTTVQPQFDIWSLDIAPGSTPELFLPAADSPAVIRP